MNEVHTNDIRDAVARMRDTHESWLRGILLTCRHAFPENLSAVDLDSVNREAILELAGRLASAYQERLGISDPIERLARPLSQREWQIACRAADGQTNKEIAYDLGISHATVRVLVSRAAHKMCVRTRAELKELFLAYFDAGGQKRRPKSWEDTTRPG